jgi:hypothetical protein
LESWEPSNQPKTFKHSAPTAQQTLSFSVISTKQAVLYIAATAASSDTHIKHVNALSKQNVKILIFYSIF